jgi:DNA polymerase III subunit beta
MKLTCTQENFKRAIFNSERVVSKQTTLPILNNILLEGSKNSLKLSATNLEIGVVVKIGAKVEKEGKITIPAKLISNFVNNLPVGEKILLETIDQGLKIKSGQAKAIIKGLPATDFPLIPQKNNDFQFQLAGKELRLIINKVLASVAFNEARPELTGVNLLLSSQELLFASTDSFRLAEMRFSLKENNINQEAYETLLLKKNSIIIPATTFVELARIISLDEEQEVNVAIEEGQVFFEINGTTLVSRLINGKYPEYKHIMPKEFKTRIVGEKNLFQGAVKMASVFTSTKTNEIILKSEQEGGKIFIEARSAEVGENSTELKMDVQGPTQEVVFNSKYLLDGVNTINTAQLAILVNTGSTPVALREINEKTGEILDDYTYIVMPIKN